MIISRAIWQDLFHRSAVKGFFEQLTPDTHVSSSPPTLKVFAPKPFAVSDRKLSHDSR
jgi:hypothetical protein